MCCNPLHLWLPCCFPCNPLFKRYLLSPYQPKELLVGTIFVYVAVLVAGYLPLRSTLLCRLFRYTPWMWILTSLFLYQICFTHWSSGVLIKLSGKFCISNKKKVIFWSTIMTWFSTFLPVSAPFLINASLEFSFVYKHPYSNNRPHSVNTPFEEVAMKIYWLDKWIYTVFFFTWKCM